MKFRELQNQMKEVDALIEKLKKVKSVLNTNDSIIKTVKKETLFKISGLN